MNRTFESFPVTDYAILKQQVLRWSNRFSTCCFLDNNEYQQSNTAYQCMAAAGKLAAISSNAGQGLDQLNDFIGQQPDWLFGHLGFDLKAETMQSPSSLPDFVGFPDLFFFVPEIIVLLGPDELSIGCFGSAHASVWEEILRDQSASETVGSQAIRIRERFSKEEYIDVVKKLQVHILRGDCYEINFCQEFYAENILADPLQLYFALNQLSPAPFAGFYKLDDKYLLCTSPERFLKRTGDQLISQPIKGTAPRDLLNAVRDDQFRENLFQSEKDRAENVMIVDLVRNDLSKICEQHSVVVDELYGVYRFAQVHQLISTVRGTLKRNKSLPDVLAATFPMGSMTGAPKKKVLELIERYERTRRGLYSGSIGYMKPEGDFDFNVVIRSILYNRSSRYISYQVGSGITFSSDPENEYEECRLKAYAMEQVIKNPAGEHLQGS